MTAFRQRVINKRPGRGVAPAARFAAARVGFAAADLTDQQVRDMLGAAVSAYLKADGCYGYIKDVNRAQGFVTFTCWEMGEGGEELYKADFSISDDYQVTLGDPQEVVQTARYEPVAEEQDGGMSVFSLLPASSAHAAPRAAFGVSNFSRREDPASGCAIYDNALLFRAGHYPDKQFSMTPGELAQAAASWSPVGGNIQHSDFLAGRAGVISRAWIDPADPSVLRGEVRVPLSLDRLLTQGEKGISMEWNRAGKFADGFALVTNPRVSDAALMALERSAPLPMSLEAQLSPPAPEISHGSYQAPTTGGERKKNMKLSQLVASFVASFRGQQGVEDDLSAAPTATAPGNQAPTTTQVPTTTLFGYPITQPGAQVQLGAQVQAGQDPLMIERTARIKAESSLFASEVISASRALPAERDSLVAQYFQAAMDDLNAPTQVAFSYAGQPRTGTRVEALKAAMAARPAHSLTQDLWPSVQPTDVQFQAVQPGQSVQSGQAVQPAQTQVAPQPIVFSVSPGGPASPHVKTIDPAKACRIAAGAKE